LVMTSTLGLPYSFLCFLRTLPGLNFAVIENCTVFKLGNLSLAYLHCLIGFCLHLHREAERKITTGLYDFFGKQWEQVTCCHVSQLLIVENIYYYFEII
jgi:hypothetical protein